MRRLRRAADVLRQDGDDTYARFVSWMPADEVEEMTGDVPESAQLYADVLARATGIPRREMAPLLDLVSYLPEDILTKVDRASMAVSLEVRAPLLDHRVVELALAMPLALKRHGTVQKVCLRSMLYARVPQALVDRPKMGFGVPLERWLRGPLRDEMERLCAGDTIASLGLNPVPVRRRWQAFRDGRTREADQAWQLFSLLAWARQH